MRLTIIPSDNAVYVDNESRSPLDLTGCGIPADVHALQWYETQGWIEFNDDGNPFTPRKDNEIISIIPEWANLCVDVWVASPPPEPAFPDIEAPILVE